MNDKLAAADLVRWCLHPQSDKRPQSVEELLQHHFFDKTNGLFPSKVLVVSSAVPRNKKRENQCRPAMTSRVRLF